MVLLAKTYDECFSSALHHAFDVVCVVAFLTELASHFDGMIHNSVIDILSDIVAQRTVREHL